MACANMATKDWDPPVEGEVPDPSNVFLPDAITDDVYRNPNVKSATCDEDVIVDSGASDCMVPSPAYLDFITSTFHLVTCADGSLHECNFKGLLRLCVARSPEKRMGFPCWIRYLSPV